MCGTSSQCKVYGTSVKSQVGPAGKTLMCMCSGTHNAETNPEVRKCFWFTICTKLYTSMYYNTSMPPRKWIAEWAIQNFQNKVCLASTWKLQDTNIACRITLFLFKGSFRCCGSNTVFYFHLHAYMHTKNYSTASELLKQVPEKPLNPREKCAHSVIIGVVILIFFCNYCHFSITHWSSRT